MKRLYLLVDPSGLPCVWMIVRGFTHTSDSGSLCLTGSVILRGPDAKRNESSPMRPHDANGTWILGLPGTSWANLTEEIAADMLRKGVQ